LEKVKHLLDWVIYVADCIKAFGKAGFNLLDSWPTRPRPRDHVRADKINTTVSHPEEVEAGGS